MSSMSPLRSASASVILPRATIPSDLVSRNTGQTLRHLPHFEHFAISAATFVVQALSLEPILITLVSGAASARGTYARSFRRRRIHQIRRGGATRAAARGRRSPQGRRDLRRMALSLIVDDAFLHRLLLASCPACTSWRRRHDGYQDRLFGNTLSGLSTPLGSNTLFISRIIRISTGAISLREVVLLCEPYPVLPRKRPPQRHRPVEYLVHRLLHRLDLPGSAALRRKLTWILPSPAWAKLPTFTPCFFAIPSIMSSASGILLLGTQMSSFTRFGLTA